MVIMYSYIWYDLENHYTIFTPELARGDFQPRACGVWEAIFNDPLPQKTTIWELQKYISVARTKHPGPSESLGWADVSDFLSISQSINQFTYT